VDRLGLLGAEAIEAPLVRIVPPDDYGPLDEACARVGDFDWIVFSSANAVEVFLTRLLASPLDLRALGTVRLCAIGPQTADRLARHGLKVDLTPPEYRAETLVQSILGLDAKGPNGVRGLKVLLPRADIGREVVADELRRQGADVTDVIAYRTVAIEPERDGGPDIYRLLLEGRIDVVTFTSPSAVRTFVHLLGAEPAADLLQKTVVASIGPVTAEAAAQFQIHSAIVPQEYTVPALVDAIAKHFAREIA
jgi:uroporphyrinogen III methyltransferase/synthase